MTLKSYLTDLYGGRIYHLTKALKNVKCKLARITNHIIFLVRCRDNQLVPKGMMLRHNFSSAKAESILKKAEDALVRDQIVSLRQKKAEEIRAKDRLLLSLKNTMSERDFNIVMSVTDKAENGEYQNMKSIKQKKFAALVHTRRNTDVQQRQIITNAVDNRSGCELTADEQRILEKGLGFSPSPEAVPVKEIICAVEASLSKVPNVTEANVIRSKVSNVLSRAGNKTLKDNLTAGERKALTSLRRRSDIKILPADKGNTTVILSDEQYKEKMNELLRDQAYVKVNKDPTAVKEKQIRKVVDEVYRSGGMSEGLARKLKPNHSLPPRLYGLPKIHKEGVPLRPITSMIGSPAYDTAAYLTKIISPALGKTEFTVPNSKTFVDQVKQLDLDGSEEMISFDVVSLFTRVPVKDAVDVICSKLSEDDTLFERSELSVDNIRKLMLACLECRYFLCQGSFYEQKEGAPMGLSLSVTLANAYMEHLEESVLDTAPLKPTFWRRYVDDTFILWKHGSAALETFHQHLNNFCPAIQFTLEREKEQELPFLDVLVSHDQGKLKTSVYRKSTTSNVYLKFDSNHPMGMKAGIAKCLATRAEAVCSEASSLRKERNHICDILEANGYPRKFVKKAIKKKRQEPQTEADEEPRAEKMYAKVPYVPGISEQIAKILRPKGIQVAHSSGRLRGRLVRVKDRLDPRKSKGAVYRISCSCGSCYIGESGRPKNVRLKEHVADLKFARLDKSATARHFAACGGEMNPLDAETLAIEGHWKRRKVREAIEIKQARASINNDEGGVRLSPIWDILINRDRP